MFSKKYLCILEEKVYDPEECVYIIKKRSCFLKVRLCFDVRSCGSENQGYAFEKQPLVLKNSSMKNRKIWGKLSVFSDGG